MATPRVHLGPVRGPTVLGVVAAGVLIGALVVTGRWQHHPSSQPAARSAAAAAAATPVSLGPLWTCPLAAPVPGFADHHSYPPGHPATPPRTLRPVACYPTGGQAAAAGYPPAPLPAGTLAVGGVYLVPTGDRLQRRCQAAADRLGFAVPCPGLLPAMSPHAVPPAPCDQRFACEEDFGFLLEEDGFLVPPDYVGPSGQDAGRLVVAAATNRAAEPMVACEDQQRPVATAAVHGRPGRLVDCLGAGLHHDSVLVRWRERGVVMVVSVLGHTQLQRQLALTVAGHTRPVTPGRRAGARP
jgi:hypothetical protein